MTPLDHALAYANLGWRVAPAKPGTKRPSIDQWQKLANNDPVRIRRYWTKHPDHGVCIVTGIESAIFAIDIDPDKGGDDSLRALETVHGPLPDTAESLTGGGGRHLIYRWPTDGDIRNNQSGRLGIGIDIRGTGGQIVAPPTIHPNGRGYHWEVEHSPLDGHAVAEAPGWLLDLLNTDPAASEPRRTPRPRIHGEVLPGEWWEANTDWPTELARYGWQLHSTHNDATGEYYELWTRPGKHPDEGASASLYYKGSNVLKVFSTDAAPLRPDETYTLWGFHVTNEHSGDFETAARVVGGMMRARPGEPTVINMPCPKCGSTNTNEVAA